MPYVHIWIKDWQRVRETYLDHGALVILTGTSPRLRENGKPKQHAVVARTNGWGLEMIHDPHPDNTFLDTEKGVSGFWMWIFPTLPAAPIAKAAS